MSLPRPEGTSGKSGPPQESNMFAERNLLIILYSLQCKKKISLTSRSSGFQVARREVQRPVHKHNFCVVQQRASGREKLLENDRAWRVLLGGIKILNLTGGIQVQGRIYHTTNPAQRYGLSAPLANGIDSSVLRLEDHDADVLQVLTTASAPSVLYCFPRGNVSEEMRRPVGQTEIRRNDELSWFSIKLTNILFLKRSNEVTKMGTTPQQTGDLMINKHPQTTAPPQLTLLSNFDKFRPRLSRPILVLLYSLDSTTRMTRQSPGPPYGHLNAKLLDSRELPSGCGRTSAEAQCTAMVLPWLRIRAFGALASAGGVLVVPATRSVGGQCGSMLDRALDARAPHTLPIPFFLLGAGATALASHSSQSLPQGRRHCILHPLGLLPSNSRITMPPNSFTIRIVRSSFALLSSRSATNTGLCWWIGREEKKCACTSGVVWRREGSGWDGMGWDGAGRDAGRDQTNEEGDGLDKAPYDVMCGPCGKGRYWITPLRLALALWGEPLSFLALRRYIQSLYRSSNNVSRLTGRAPAPLARSPRSYLKLLPAQGIPHRRPLPRCAHFVRVRFPRHYIDIDIDIELSYRSPRAIQMIIPPRAESGLITFRDLLLGAAASLRRHPIRLWPAARDYPFLGRTVHSGRCRSSLSGGTIVMLRREFIRWKDGRGMGQQRSAPGGGMTTIASSSLPGRAEDDTEGYRNEQTRRTPSPPSASCKRVESKVWYVFFLPPPLPLPHYSASLFLTYQSADLSPLPYRNSLCSKSPRRSHTHSRCANLVGDRVRPAPRSPDKRVCLPTARAPSSCPLLRIDGLDARTHEGYVPPSSADGHWGWVPEGAKGSADGPSFLNLFAPPIDGLDACTHEAHPSAPVRTAFAFMPPVPPRRLFLTVTSENTTCSGGRFPRFEPRETHAFQTRRLTVDVWRSYAHSRSNVAISHTSAGTLGARRVESGREATCQAKRQWSLAGGRVAACTDLRRTMSCLLGRDWQYIGFLDV
ncbi:hypothetical protein DFH08DRAFT_1024479 [Mycena albidolilacea]|uniref:Uncharacterized protein n=1 Tax=Mycena albidolilacea TaxID=1033008 RepID=A0AAD7ALD3_9AGAR|nr:hypothetical protein DFH08DRAFT_1024479 [Mycena albidolilacea]